VIAVTGATGHLGQWVVARLIELGEDVLSVSRRPKPAPTLEEIAWRREVRTLSWDLTDAASLPEIAPVLREAEAVVHLAAFIPPDTASPKEWRATLAANVNGTVNLLRALSESRALRSFVLASSFEVYGRPLELPIAETHPTRPTTCYGASKLAAEQFVTLFGRDTDVACCAIRMPAVYGPGDGIARALGSFIRAAAAGEPLSIHGDGSDVRDLVFVGDAAEAIALATSRRCGGVFNVGSGRGYTIREMADGVCRAADREVPIARRERSRQKLDYVLDDAKARRELGWEPRVGLDEGIRAQLDWVRRVRSAGGDRES
jgi:UDP-glucose 4-epimerase